MKKVKSLISTTILSAAITITQFCAASYAKPSKGTVLITGGNSGIGFGLVKKYLEDGYKVIATYRKEAASKELLSIKSQNLQLIKAELSKKDAAEKIKQKIQNTPIDILVNNACFFPHKANYAANGLSQTQWVAAFKVCTIRPIEISLALQNNIKSSKQRKIIMIGSRVSSTTMNTAQPLLNYEGRYGYKSVKAALHSASITLAKDMQKEQITVTIIHPGAVKTKLVVPKGTEMTPTESAEKVFKIVSKITPEHNMAFLDENMNPLPF